MAKNKQRNKQTLPTTVPRNQNSEWGNVLYNLCRKPSPTIPSYDPLLKYCSKTSSETTTLTCEYSRDIQDANVSISLGKDHWLPTTDANHPWQGPSWKRGITHALYVPSKQKGTETENKGGEPRGMLWVFGNGFSYFWILSNENISCRGAETMFYIFQFIAQSIWLTEGHTVDAQRHLPEPSECGTSRKLRGQLLLGVGSRAVEGWDRTVDYPEEGVTRWGRLGRGADPSHPPVWNPCLYPSEWLTVLKGQALCQNSCTVMGQWDTAVNVTRRRSKPRQRVPSSGATDRARRTGWSSRTFLPCYCNLQHWTCV